MIALFLALAALAAPTESWDAHRAQLDPPQAPWEHKLRESLLNSCTNLDCSAGWSASPIVTRAGFPRFAGSIMRDPAFSPLIAERLRAGGEAPEVRAALAELLARAGADLGGVVVGLAHSEKDPLVLSLLVSHARWSGAETARALAEIATTHPSPMVRLEAVTALGRRADGTDFSGYILKFLADRNIEVRSAASQAAGWLALTPAFDPLARLLDDPDADVRRHALRAMGRIDPLRAAAHPAVSRLAADLDPKVRAIADDLLTP